MFTVLQIFLVGMAVVVDTALLLTVFERRNWRNVTVPVALLIFAAWLVHMGTFVDLLVLRSSGGWSDAVRWLARSTTVAGLLLMPSALLHAVARLWRSGLELRPRPNRWHLLSYVPLAVLPPAMVSLATDPARPFLELLAAYVYWYVAGVSLANIGSAIAFLGLRHRSERREVRSFLALIAYSLLALTALLLFVFWFARDAWPAAATYWVLAVVLAPLVPTLLFAYFVIRFHFMQLILERTAVYGTILVCVLLFHQLVVADLIARLGDQYRVNFGLVEGAAMIALVLLYQPLRERAAEALRYLMGSRVAGVRERLRRLSVDMWSHAGRPPRETVDWFVDAVREAIGVKYAASWLFDESVQMIASSGATHRLPETQVLSLHQSLRSHDFVSCNRRSAPDASALEWLTASEASLAVRLDYQGVSGLLLLGRRPLGRDLGEEETSAVLLLVEQLGVTLYNSVLQQERLAAERRALQNEKLSTLGLLSSCITHEIKNPLSSIKTIATVLAEQLGPGSEHAEDLRLILSEVDRLAATTSQLLQFARPSDADSGPVTFREALQGTLHVLTHLANRRGVSIQTSMPDDLPPVAADANAVREIFFNLLVNSIEAAASNTAMGGRQISLECQPNGHYVVATLVDDGPGIPNEVQDHLFEPFMTTKDSGTGLGLYIVSRRVAELAGEIHFDSVPGKGTSFTVKLPRAK